jgi:hypothetical protein
MWTLVDQQIQDMLRQSPEVSAVANEAAERVLAGALSPVEASDRIVRALFGEATPHTATRAASRLS